jgi:hypothetical protein
MSDDLREDMAEVNALLDDLERSRFSHRRKVERSKWTVADAWTLYAAAWMANVIATLIAGFALMRYPCHGGGAAALWLKASFWITGGLMFAPLLVAMAGLRVNGD